MQIDTEIVSQLKMHAPDELKQELIDLAESGESDVLAALRKKYSDDGEFVVSALEWWLARGLRKMIPVILAPLTVRVEFAGIKGRYDPVELPEGASVLEVNPSESTE